jgi:arginyl-tRNA synthetase
MHSYNPQELKMSLVNIVQQQCDTALKALYSTQYSQLPFNELAISQATNNKFGHYQFNGAMKLAKILGKAPRQIAEEISHQISLQASQLNLFATIEVAGPGFINFSLSPEYLSELINIQLKDPRQGVAIINKKRRVVIDFSSPNIAKEMHVGHLRSTIIGDCIARILEFLGNDLLRLNHIGDWGTQFGMLIAYFKDRNLDLNQIQQLDLSQLVAAYRAAKQKFDESEEFKQKSQSEVVTLQSGDSHSKAIWNALCAASRSAYDQIYDLLDIHLIERGESFYNPYLPEIIADLESKNLITISDGAKCIYLDGFMNREGEPLPLIVQKSDGGYNYATTDLAASRHRVNVEHGTWLIYVTDAGQAQHFSMVFAASRKAGYYDPSQVRVDHVPFGLVLRSDGKKFKTRSGDTERLIDLLNSAIERATEILKERNNPEFTATDIATMAHKLGLNAIKYADLANNRVSDYTFNIDRMLQFEGNTAAFLSYAYVRVQSIKRKFNLDPQQLMQTNQISLQTPEEIDLGLQVLRFSEVLHNFTEDLLPNRITEYLYHLAEKFHTFFHNCRVEGSAEQNSRLLLCEAVAQVLGRGINLLGLQPLEKM